MLPVDSNATVEESEPVNVKQVRIYEQAKDLHVRNYVVYSGVDQDLYADSERTIPVTYSEVKDAFLKGCLLIELNGNRFVKPAAMFESERYCTIGYEPFTAYWSSWRIPINNGQEK